MDRRRRRYVMLSRAMLTSLTSQLGVVLRSPKILTGVAFTLAAAAAIASYTLTRKKPSAEELERERRELLASTGRIVDGSITETHWAGEVAGPIPHTLIYRYRASGVTYECAQDVSPLGEHVRNVRIDLPVQVRIDPRNPGNSIVVAESWSGLRVDHDHPILADRYSGRSVAQTQGRVAVFARGGTALFTAQVGA